MPIEPPEPSAEQLGSWQALVERIRQGDRSQVLGWDEAAAGTGATYQLLGTHQVHGRLRDAPPFLVGTVAGVMALLPWASASRLFGNRAPSLGEPTMARTPRGGHGTRGVLVVGPV